MKITRTNTDSDFADSMIEDVLRKVLEQPSPWFIGIGFTPEPGDDRRVEGIIADLNIEGSMVTIQDHDEDDRPTGAETTLDLNDITEIEVY
jgi:hypothetical protein